MTLLKVRPHLPVLGAFESTFQPIHDRDILETTGHVSRWREDLDLMLATGVTTTRYPVRWHRIEVAPGQFDWRHTDLVLGYMQQAGLHPILDLLHHTSYPRWIGDLSSPEFPPAFLRFAEAVARRYPWIAGYTLCNEPFTTVLMCGQLGIWPPYETGLAGFIRLATNILPTIAQASLMFRELLPDAQHLHVEIAERHTWSTPQGEEFARMTNDRRFLLTDLLVGHPVTAERPFVQELMRVGADALLGMEPGHIDVLGIDYYAHNQWHWSGIATGTTASPDPVPLEDLLVEYAARYGLPCVLGETNIRGFASDRAGWLKYTLEQCENAQRRGVDLRGYCWFPFIDSADWGSLLAESTGAIDPVGVYWLNDALDRRPSCMSRAYASAAAGVRAADLPAYHFRRPVADWIRGWIPQMAHWDWVTPPQEPCSNHHAPDDQFELRCHDQVA